MPLPLQFWLKRPPPPPEDCPGNQQVGIQIFKLFFLFVRTPQNSSTFFAKSFKFYPIFFQLSPHFFQKMKCPSKVPMHFTLSKFAFFSSMGRVFPFSGFCNHRFAAAAKPRYFQNLGQTPNKTAKIKGKPITPKRKKMRTSRHISCQQYSGVS